jgi:uncharacterized membrane protein YgcG
MRPRTAVPFLTIVGLLCLVAPAVRAQSHHIQHVLDKVEPDLKLTDVPLSDALDYIRDTTDTNMVVDWKSLEAVNIDRNTLINLRLHNVTLRKALTIILNEAGAGNVLTFYVQDNVLEITTQAKADSVLYTMVYPVQDLLVTVPNFQLSDVTNLASSISSGGGGTTVGGSGGGGGSSSNNSLSGAFSGSGSSTNTDTTQQQSDALVKLIMDTVRPEVWRENGGNSTIRFFNGMLIVTAPLSVQEAIGGPVE